MKVIDYFEKIEINSTDSLKFIIKVEDGGNFVFGYTANTQLFHEAEKTEIFTKANQTSILNTGLDLDRLIRSIAKPDNKYVYGKYRSLCLFHIEVVSMFDKPVQYQKFNNVYEHVYQDDSTTYEHEKTNMFYGTSGPTNVILENNDYTFGIEIETSHGRVEKYQDLNLMCVYDGSLKDENGNCYGGEYVTGVLMGDAGVFHLKKIVNRLVESKCGVNNKCSIHVHVGNINWTQEQTIMAWALGCTLEHEMFSMMPPSRSNNVFCQTLKSKLPLEINFKGLKTQSLLDGKISTSEIYNKIHQIVVSGTSKMPNKEWNKMSNHPEGSKQRYNHNAQRYCWLNFVPLMFNIRNDNNARTIEFRSHSSTLNYKKIESWLKICIAFVAIIDNHLNEYKKGKINTIADILRIAYPKNHQVLIDYVESRKIKFRGDNIAELDEYNELIQMNNESLKELVCA